MNAVIFFVYKQKSVMMFSRP